MTTSRHYPAGVLLAFAILSTVAAFLWRACRKIAQISAAAHRDVKPANIFRGAALCALLGCAAAAPIVSTVGGIACGVLSAILGPAGEFWGTACDGLVKAIADEIAADTTPATVAARTAAPVSCKGAALVPVPGYEGAASVCPGLEVAAARGIGKAIAAGKAARR